MEKKRNLVLYIAASLDGYIAREDDALDWLFKADAKGQGDNGYAEFYEGIETILMGRKTYEQILILENGSFPYKGKECYVFSGTEREDTGEVQFISGDITDFTNRLKSRDGNAIWLVGGGELLQTFLREKLVDEIILTVIPVILGKGIPLFIEGAYESELSLKEMKQFNQFAQLHYIVE